MIYERLDPGNPLNAELRPVTRAHMEGFGAAGLRTLCLASAVLDPDFYDECAQHARAWAFQAHMPVHSTGCMAIKCSEPAATSSGSPTLTAWSIVKMWYWRNCRWQDRYHAAKTALSGRDDALAAAAEVVEVRLQLLGCTAIEDKLQPGVSEAIANLAAAGIRLWVLTGDKQARCITCCVSGQKARYSDMHIPPVRQRAACALKCPILSSAARGEQMLQASPFERPFP